MIVILSIIVVILIIFYYRKYEISNPIDVLSYIDGNNYKIHPAHINKVGASNTLAIINNKINEIVLCLKDVYLKDVCIKDSKKQKIIDNISSRYNPNNLIENSPLNIKKETSYVVDKGSIFALCLREKKYKNKLHDINLLLFVTLHELSHLAIEGLGHDFEFWSTFKFILSFCRNQKLYFSVDYKKYPQMYCGLLVDYNPLFDDSIIDI